MAQYSAKSIIHFARPGNPCTKSYDSKSLSGPLFLFVRRKIFPRNELFVSKGDDGIVTRSAQSRIDCTRRRAKNGKENRAKDPLIGDGDLQGWDGLREDSFGQKREGDADDTSDDGESQRFTQQELRDTRAGKSECLEDADFACAFEDEGVHVQEDDEKTDDDADADHRLDERFELGEVRRIHERHVFGDGNILGGFKWDEEASAFAVSDNTADGKSVIHK